MTSIRRQLLVSLFVALTIAGLGAAVGVYLQARREANALFNYHLKQIALALRDHAATAIAVASSDADDAEQELVIQIWDDAGLHLYHSHTGHPPPPQTRPGWTTVTTRHGAWHVFSLHDDDRIIQVAQPLAVRSALAAQMAARTLLPWLVVVVGLAGVIWWVIGRGLRPLMVVAHAVEARTPEALESLPVTGLPYELQPIVTALNALFQRLTITMAAQQAFIADAAHALRTPLTAVHLQAQVVARARDDAERQEALDTLQQAVQRATHLVQQLLTLAREAPDAAQPPLVPIEVPPLLAAVIADHALLAAERGIDFGLVRADPGWIRGDADSLRLLVANLLDNALRYTPAGGTVDVASTTVPQAIRVEISDTGPGIPSADAARVFDRFYRGANATVPGTGLGLAIVKTIAERHHATVTLRPRPDRPGLVVCVTFPRC
jgi:two-component system OmpR family sensor kinase